MANARLGDEALRLDERMIGVDQRLGIKLGIGFFERLSRTREYSTTVAINKAIQLAEKRRRKPATSVPHFKRTTG
ncbi:MAG: hypothetical protein IPP88_17760 [Betaproteobacteria bacterium]|nr:hypothetical protein [Betaproteobacteria bacterium]